MRQENEGAQKTMTNTRKDLERGGTRRAGVAHHGQGEKWATLRVLMEVDYFVYTVKNHFSCKRYKVLCFC